jgi:hypothetical protein
MPHHWTELDDIAALYVYLYGVDDIPYSVEAIADRLKIGRDSFKMRLRNFLAIDGKGGLENYANQSRVIYDRHCNTPQKTLRDIAFPELS